MPSLPIFLLTLQQISCDLLGSFKNGHTVINCPDLVMDSAAEVGEGEGEEAGRTEVGVAGGGASGPSGSGTRATGDMRGQEIK